MNYTQSANTLDLLPDSTTRSIMNLLALLMFVSAVLATAVSLAAGPVETANVVVLAGTNTATFLYSPIVTNVHSTPTEAPTEALIAAANKLKFTSTTTRRVRVIATTVPGIPQPFLVFPFHLSTAESCASGATYMKGVFKNGDWVEEFSLNGPGTAVFMMHRVPGLPETLRVGPYDFTTGVIDFGYDHGDFTCGWRDEDKGQGCGHCKAGDWSTEALDCDNNDNEGMGRVKELDCKFVLGWLSELQTTAKPTP
ncbi:hypothetical protein GMOD_00005587 [Pyrenophora seminiperda CCB06]|uniref:Uncharacterized protein n=1 Tax=Pyrenophora seminiperda CCB06 TaxID=1302712 RepID=A0A3M7M992_9PLEO|nr:hypothetical protein GMOD_00005587 [Pyrenophora seminiperda CCB06]